MTVHAAVTRAQDGDLRAAEHLVRRYQRLAYRIAGRYYAPGLDRDDLRQVALTATLSAIHAWRPSSGVPFPAFAGVVIERKLRTAVDAANRPGRRILSDAIRDGIRDDDGDLFEPVDFKPDPETDPARIVERRDELRRLIAAVRDSLTGLERAALLGRANGLPYERIGPVKAVDNALQRARVKLTLTLGEGAA